jgi:hypothetical protein
MSETETGLAKFEAQIPTIFEEAEKTEVTDQPSLDRAREFSNHVKAIITEIQSAFRPIVEAAYRTWKAALTREKHYLTPYEKASEIIRGKITVYLMEEARKRAEAETARLRAEADRKRIQDEAVAKAVQADQEGKRLEANAILDKAAEAEIKIQTPFLPPKAKAEGLNIRATWEFEIREPGLVPREFCSPDPKKIDTYLHGFLNDPTPLPGIRFFVKQTLVNRGPK